MPLHIFATNTQRRMKVGNTETGANDKRTEIHTVHFTEQQFLAASRSENP